MMNDGEQLREMELFSGFTDEEFSLLDKVLQRKSYKANETIFRENERDQILYIIYRGEVRVCKATASGDSHTITMLEDGDICGEMSFHDGRPHSASIVATVDTVVYLLLMTDFQDIIPNHPFLTYKLMRNILFNVNSIVRRMNSRYMEMVGYMWGRSR